MVTLPRASGILLHVTSLPGPFGIGSLGDEAYAFVDFLSQAGQRLWQVLSLGPTGYGNSPYHCPSAFACNPLLISIEKLVEEGLLNPSDLADGDSLPAHRVNYQRVTQYKEPLLQKSFRQFENRTPKSQQEDFEVFCEESSFWLDDFALFMALRKQHKLAPWNTWPEDVRRRASQSLKRWHQSSATEVRYQKYLQYQFSKQWLALRRHCKSQRVQIIGDVPIYVAWDSADVWCHQDLFRLDSNGNPTVVAGVPPDYFSDTGQLWGNPIYRWDEIAKEGYRWWTERLRTTLKTVDIVRLDHFRGFEKYWEVPANETTAVKGRWIPGPGPSVFEAIRQGLGDVPIIAEDLGVITPEVHALRDRFGFPGMRVLQFAFNGGPDNPHLPHNYPPNCVVYTGTHDNDTVVGWCQAAAPDATLNKGEWEKERQRALNYLGSTAKEVHWSFIRAALASAANTAIIPLQDVLGLGTEARMNRPGTTEGNWEWRFSFDMLTDDIKHRLRELTELYGRVGAN